ncbi:hypothetical protein HBI81_039090 [Parastagonospora nodorum]|nr:hypothetical protein HBH53_008980 [Parastagonospora nodorum]KAH4058758.1 hypothetical protein HBH49_037270 [Parastagonospora nodorum]KAH4198435.1 hypothetical protein HBH42_044340 [Parastagonospora nodorum]KAH4237585.1 hypothetical protein HBI05_123080 [Parastagonospora nodorum]KAH4237995.1 hypothetical protein HBI06_044940 [Parastagonospora nodorum]
MKREMRYAAADKDDIPEVHHKWFHGLHLDRCVFITSPFGLDKMWNKQGNVREICGDQACSQRIANVPVGSKRTYL